MSEKLTDTRRSALRDSGIFPRSGDFNLAFAVLGALLAYRSIDLDFVSHYETSRIFLISLSIPLGAALGSIFATLIQSRFLFRFSFSREKKELSFTNCFYSLIKMILCTVLGALLFRQLLSDASTGTLKLQSFIQTTALGIIGLLVVFGLVGMLMASFTFVQRYQMSKGEMEADAREGEMRPEVKAAMDSSFAGDRED